MSPSLRMASTFPFFDGLIIVFSVWLANLPLRCGADAGPADTPLGSGRAALTAH